MSSGDDADYMDHSGARDLDRRVVIIGTSVRAAAASARRAGWQPIAFDQFGDVDLCEAAATHPFRHADELLPLVAAYAGRPVIYTGAFENRANLLEEIARRHPIWGVTGHALRSVRSPAAVARVLRQAGLPALEVRAGNAPPSSGTWMCKPLASGGGLGVRRCDLDDPGKQAVASGSEYWQEYRPGKVVSGCYCATPRGQVRLLGQSEALPPAGEGFVYRGSICPSGMSVAAIRRTQEIGSIVGDAFRLRGLFGIDFVLDDAGELWLLEVNPRYPATAELVERVFLQGASVIDAHVAAFTDAEELAAMDCISCAQEAQSRRYLGKEIVYARRRVAFAESLRAEWMADIPAPGTLFEAGQPVCTVFGEGASAAECAACLAARREALLAEMEI